MSSYLLNYWTLYREFIQTFKNLKFRDVPIALFTNFYQQIDGVLKSEMEKEDFHQKLMFPILQQESIQPYFETLLEKIKAPLQINPDGKVLINMDYTRIPETSYKKWFHPNQTILLSRSKSQLVYGIPNQSILNYQEADNMDSEDLVKSAKYLFSKLEKHPAFSNEFFQTTFLNRIPLIVKTLNSVNNFYDKNPISFLVVGTTEDMLSRALAVIGSMKGIPSICLQHGILMGEEAFLPVFTSFTSVYGEYEKNWYTQRGLEVERIAAIGHPKYDTIFTYSSARNENPLIGFGLDPKKLTLLVITGPNLDLVKFKKLIKNLAEKFQMLIKPHPWEIGKGKSGPYLELEKQYPNVKVVTSRDTVLYDLISHADGVVSTLSTVASEGILFNKPVFVFDFLFSNRPYDYYDSLGEFTLSNPDQLSEAVNKYFSLDQQKELYNSVRKQFISESYNDGTSGKKLINFIKQYNHVDTKG